MSHLVGRIVHHFPVRIGTDGETTSYSYKPEGKPRFVILHFTQLTFHDPGARLEVELGYGLDVFSHGSQKEGWTRPIDPSSGPIEIRFVGGSGGATLVGHAAGEKHWVTGQPGTESGSQTNPDLFLQDAKYEEPVYETRLLCGPEFSWSNSLCWAPHLVQSEAAHAVCVIVMVHRDFDKIGPSTCTGTLIAPDLVLTGSHCFSTWDETELLSASVGFDYWTTCEGLPSGNIKPTYHKIKRIVQRGWNDWLILQIETPPEGLGITPRKLRQTAFFAGEEVFVVHHPNGAIKKTATGTLTTASVRPVVGFDYAGGSSGSAIFDAEGRVMGVLSKKAGSSCEVDYVASHTILSEISNEAESIAPVFDVMLVIDRSGATAGTLEEMRSAASLFVKLVRGGAEEPAHRLGLVSFADDATTDVALKIASAEQKDALLAALENLQPGGDRSLGRGVARAMESLLPGGNRRGILLLTSGKNTVFPNLDNVSFLLGDTILCIAGFGPEEELDGALLTRMAREHNGIYMRAGSGLELVKFFLLNFGTLLDPYALAYWLDDLLIDEKDAQLPKDFHVSGDSALVILAGSTDSDEPLEPAVIPPAGTILDAATPGVETVRGKGWVFLRIPPSLAREHAGRWRWKIEPANREGKYFAGILRTGGPRLTPILPQRRVYVGDVLQPQVALRDGSGRAPFGSVELTVEAPDAPLGELVACAGLAKPIIGRGPADAFQATLRKLAAPRRTRSITAPLHDDGRHGDGAMERDGTFGGALADVTRCEGTYTFHAKARFGDDLQETSETSWSIHVEPSIDAAQTTVDVLTDRALRVTPRDVYGNRLGPGRAHLFELWPQPGTTIRGVRDNGDGSYDIPATWTGSTPGLIVTQPERPPVTIAPARETPIRWPLWLAALVVLVLIILVVLLS